MAQNWLQFPADAASLKVPNLFLKCEYCTDLTLCIVLHEVFV
jgi:hypothetical protein